MAGSIKIQQGTTPSTPQAGFSTLWVKSSDGEFYYTKPDGVTKSLVGATGSTGSQGIQGATGIGLGLNSKSGSHGGTAGWYFSGGEYKYDVVFAESFLSSDYTAYASISTAPGLNYSFLPVSNPTASGFTVSFGFSPASTWDFQWSAIANGETSVSYYGNFLSTITQSNAGATAANTVTFNTTDLSSGVSVVSNSRITIANAGIYNIEFSAQLQKSSGGDDIAEIWLAKNGTNVPDSAGKIVLSANPAYAVPAWNYLVQANAGDYYELKWHSSDTTMELHATAAAINPTRPAIPSIILSVSQISS